MQIYVILKSTQSMSHALTERYAERYVIKRSVLITGFYNKAATRVSN